MKVIDEPLCRVTRGDHDSAQIRSDRDYDRRRKRRGKLFPCNSFVILINAIVFSSFFSFANEPEFCILLSRKFIISTARSE